MEKIDSSELLRLEIESEKKISLQFVYDCNLGSGWIRQRMTTEIILTFVVHFDLLTNRPLLQKNNEISSIQTVSFITE